MRYDGDTVKQWAGDSQWRAWRADLARYRMSGFSAWGSEGFWAITIYRLQRSLLLAKPRVVWMPARVAAAIIKKIVTLLTHINLDAGAKIGPGLLILHVGPIQVVAGAEIGANCALHHVCTVGAGSRPGSPLIGDHVMMGCHSCVLGPVRIGDGVLIAAGAVVIEDVPAWTAVGGVPAKVIRPNPPATSAKSSGEGLVGTAAIKVEGNEDRGLL
jgi:serine O-acetyltransferase